MDYAHKETDKMLERLEKDITEVYKEAQQEAYNKGAEYFKTFMRRDKEMKAKVDAGELTEDEYKQWRINKMTVGKRYNAMREGLATDLANANKLAASMINNHLPDVYATNYNWSTYQIEQDARMDTNFMIYDRQTVERLIRDKPNLLPMKAGINIPEDKKWNKKNINNAITQGILLGESIPDISKRLAAVTDMNRVSAVRNARTMTTSAENGGRVDSYHRAIDMGIKITQKWLATKDNRTRHEHALLDGQEVDVGKPFKVEGYTIMFPADPQAEPHLVYNCRCTLVSKFKGFDYKKMDEYTEAKPMSYKEWEESRTKSQVDNSVVNGGDILLSFVRRSDKYEFDIEDAINAQGYDGIPKVVSAKEFEIAVNQSNFIAMRSYSAPTQEILDEYQKQLYSGKFYVDCSQGGSVFGKGMYTVSENSKSISKSTVREVEYYSKLGESRGNKFSNIETMTLEKNAKIIEYKDLVKEYNDYMQSIGKIEQFDIAKYYNDSINEIAKNKPEEAYVRRFLGLEYDKEEYKKTRELSDELLDSLDEKISIISRNVGTEQSNFNKKQQEIIENKYRNAPQDTSTYAVLKGYDAVRVVEEGQENDYTIILNRTKLIIKGGD